MNTKIEKVIIISSDSENHISNYEFIVFWSEIMSDNNQSNVNNKISFSINFKLLSEWTSADLRRNK